MEICTEDRDTRVGVGDRGAVLEARMWQEGINTLLGTPGGAVKIIYRAEQ